MDDAVWLICAALYVSFQDSSLNPRCSLMCRTTCTSLKRSHLVPSWSFPSLRGGRANSRWLHTWKLLISSFYLISQNVHALRLDFVFFSLYVAFPPASVTWTMSWGEPMPQSMAWHQVFSHGTSAKPCMWAKGWMLAQFLSTPTTRLMWPRLSEASNSLDLAKTWVRKTAAVQLQRKLFLYIIYVIDRNLFTSCLPQKI